MFDAISRMDDQIRQSRYGIAKYLSSRPGQTSADRVTGLFALFAADAVRCSIALSIETGRRAGYASSSAILRSMNGRSIETCDVVLSFASDLVGHRGSQMVREGGPLECTDQPS